MIMKRIAFLLTTCLLLIACDKEAIDEPTVDKPNATVEYFVKYEIKTKSIYSFSNIDVNYTSEKGLWSGKVTRNWEAVIGPFNKPQTIYFSADYPTDYVRDNTTFTARISICKGNQPFLLKAEKTSAPCPLSMSYTVTEQDLK